MSYALNTYFLQYKQGPSCLCSASMCLCIWGTLSVYVYICSGNVSKCTALVQHNLGTDLMLHGILTYVNRYLLVLECKTRGRQLHLPERFDPKRDKTRFVLYALLQLKKALLGPKRFAKWSCLPCVLHSRTNKYLYIDG